jgi:hypothetical protein
MFKIIKMIWILVAIAILTHHLYLSILIEYYNYDPFLLKASLTKDVIVEIILTFPIPIIIGILLDVLKITISGSIYTSILEEVITLFLGYIQWFILLPYLWKMVKNKNGKTKQQ